MIGGQSSDIYKTTIEGLVGTPVFISRAVNVVLIITRFLLLLVEHFGGLCTLRCDGTVVITLDVYFCKTLSGALWDTSPSPVRGMAIRFLLFAYFGKNSTVVVKGVSVL